MSFPLKRYVWRLRIEKPQNCDAPEFLMDEFSSKTVSEISQKFANKG